MIIVIKPIYENREKNMLNIQSDKSNEEFIYFSKLNSKKIMMRATRNLTLSLKNYEEIDTRQKILPSL